MNRNHGTPIAFSSLVPGEEYYFNSQAIVRFEGEYRFTVLSRCMYIGNQRWNKDETLELDPASIGSVRFYEPVRLLAVAKE